MSHKNNRSYRPEVDRDPRRGATTIFFAFLLVGMMGMAALVVDVGQTYTAKARLQAIADASALAAAHELPNTSEALEAAQEYAELNYPGGGVVTDQDVTAGCFDDGAFVAAGGSCSGSDLNAVRVTARLSTSNGNPLSLLLMPFLGRSSINVGATSVASAGGSASTGCLWVLHATAGSALKVDGKADVSAADCDVYVNSSHASAMLIKDNGSSIVAQNIEIKGGYSLAGGGTSNPNPPTANTGSTYADPLAGTLSPPSNVSAVCGSAHHGSNAKIEYGDKDTPLTLYPGVYCGGILAKSGATINFEPGTYIIRGGDLGGSSLKTDNEGSTLNGTGVTFYLTCKAGPCTPAGSEKHAVEFKDKTIVTLTAPSSGEYKGILFYQDPNLKGQAGGDANVFHTGQGTVFDGVFYFPSQWLDFNHGSGTGGTFRAAIIAENVHVHGDKTKLTLTAMTNAPGALGGGGSNRLVR